MHPERDEYSLVCDLGNGLEVLCTEYSFEDIKRKKQEYIDKTDIYPAIFRKRARKENRVYGKKSHSVA